MERFSRGYDAAAILTGRMGWLSTAGRELRDLSDMVTAVTPVRSSGSAAAETG